MADTTVKNFNSTMPGAPVLNGVAGALIGLLDACLVTGYDVKSAVSLVVAGGVATLTWSGTHSAAEHSVISISGVTGPLVALNGEQKVVTKPNATSVTFATTAPDGTAAGTITFKMAAAGWTKAFSATNVAVYKSTAVGSNGFCYRVDDTGTLGARVVGYESMTDAATGVGPFPTAAQMSGGGWWAKSVTANTTGIPWVVAADSRTVLFHAAPGVSANAAYRHGTTRGFGDAIGLRPGGDPFASFMNYSAQPNGSYDSSLENASSSAYSAFPRPFTGLGSAQGHWCVPYVGFIANLSGADNFLGPFPSLVDGSLKLSKRFFVQNPTSLATAGQPPRADMPGLYSSPQTAVYDSFKLFDLVPGSEALAGRTLLAVNGTNAGFGGAPTNVNTGAAFIDITGPWR